MHDRAHRPDAELVHATGRRRGRWQLVLAWIAAAPLFSTAAQGLWSQAQTWEPARANDGWPLHLGCLALEAGADPTSLRAWTALLDARGALDPTTGLPRLGAEAPPPDLLRRTPYAATAAASIRPLCADHYDRFLYNLRLGSFYGLAIGLVGASGGGVGGILLLGLASTPTFHLAENAGMGQANLLLVACALFALVGLGRGRLGAALGGGAAALGAGLKMATAAAFLPALLARRWVFLLGMVLAGLWVLGPLVGLVEPENLFIDLREVAVARAPAITYDPHHPMLRGLCSALLPWVWPGLVSYGALGLFAPLLGRSPAARSALARDGLGLFFACLAVGRLGQAALYAPLLLVPAAALVGGARGRSGAALAIGISALPLLADRLPNLLEEGLRLGLCGLGLVAALAIRLLWRAAGEAPAPLRGLGRLVLIGILAAGARRLLGL